MNAEKLKHEISLALEMTQALHDGVVENLVDASVDGTIKEYAEEVVLGLSTLHWYLQHVSEGVRS